MEFTDYFDRGAKGSLKLRNNTQLSHKGLNKQVYNNTVVDSWHVGEIMSAEYTLVVDNGRDSKEMVKVLVVAGPEDAAVTIYGRATIEEKLISISGTVDTSIFKLIVGPARAGVAGARIVYSANYYHTLSDK
ncbi:hypothetical protein OAA64_01405 [bacterium]|nr:hypothetical protein [bacterium]